MTLGWGFKEATMPKMEARKDGELVAEWTKGKPVKIEGVSCPANWDWTDIPAVLDGIVVTEVPDPPPAPPSKQDMKSGIKGAAMQNILLSIPEWKQRNMIARGVELVMKGQENWTAEEAAEAANLQSTWDKIKTLRSHSDAMEAAVDANGKVDIQTGSINGSGVWPKV